MRLENIINLTEGELCSNPYINQIDGFSFEPHLVERGFLYFASDRTPQSIDLAIKNGAYAIVYDYDCDISDDEIAWIRVQNLQNALIKLMRFQISQNEFIFLYLDKIQFGVLSGFTHDILKLPKSIEEIFLKLFNTKKRFFCSSDIVLLEKIAPQFLCLKRALHKLSLQPQSTLFLSSFVYNNRLYNTQISTLFIDEICSFVDFFEQHNLSFSINKKVDIFESIFVNSAFGIESFGSTKQAVVVFSDEQNFLESLKRIKINLPHINISTCKSEEIVGFKDFHYLFVQDEPQNIIELLQKHRPYTQPSLF